MSATRDAIAALFRESIRAKEVFLAEQADALGRAVDVVADALGADRKVLFFGNGGSAADAQHLAAELVGRFQKERAAIPAIALTVDTSVLTSVANDYSFKQVFARQVEALGAPGDVLIAITTSGTSKNVVAAVASARRLGMRVIGLTGAKGAAFVATCDAGIAVPTTNTARIQECHITIGHLLCEVLDEAFAPAPSAHGNGHAPAKQMTLEQLVAWREQQRAHKRTVVWTNGVFDVLHVGHLASLRGAKSFGDVLIVGVNSDASVRANKGPDRPIYRAEERVELLAALELVDAILVFDDQTPERVLAALKPDVHAKGADYAQKPIPERAIVESYGGRVELIPLVEGKSTTDTLARLRK
jgi:phosphoheptose isomerase